MAPEEIVIKGLLFVHVAISAITPRIFSIYALSIYLFAIAVILLAGILLFLIHWRHQVVQSRKRLDPDFYSQDSPLTQNFYQGNDLQLYGKSTGNESATKNLLGDSRYSRYDNILANDYEESYNKIHLRKVDVV